MSEITHNGSFYDPVNVLDQEACDIHTQTNGSKGGWNITVIWNDGTTDIYHGKTLNKALCRSARAALKRNEK